MYRNQYLATSRESAPDQDPFGGSAPARRFADLTVFHHPDLKLAEARCGRYAVLLLGYALDPDHPERSNQAVADDLVRCCGDQSRLFDRLECVTGRFVVLLSHIGDDGTARVVNVFNDACAFKQAYIGDYDGAFYVTSSMRMFYDFTGKPLDIRDDKRDFMASPQFTWNECGWYCDEEFDDSLKKLLPNHYYDRPLGRAVRIPFQSPAHDMAPSDVYDYCTSLMRGSYRALLGRYRPMQAITAGLDSRTLLAATKDLVSEIDYYIFDFGDPGVQSDIQIAGAIAADNNLRFRVLPVEDLTAEFTARYSREHVFPSFPLKTKGIQYHYLHHQDADLINVNGNCGEILRCYLGYSRRVVPRTSLYYYTRYSTRFDFLADAIERWYDDAVDAAAARGLTVLDLFYWELKMGTWGALYPFDQDIAIEEYSPFNNKRLLLTFMQLPAAMRKKPALTASAEWIERMWPGLTAYPTNPSPSRIKKVIFDRVYSDASLVYYFFRYRHLLNRRDAARTDGAADRQSLPR